MHCCTCTAYTLATRRAHAVRVQCTCRARVVHMRCTCRVHDLRWTYSVQMHAVGEPEVDLPYARHVHCMCTTCALLAGRAGPPPVLGARLPARPDPRATQLLDMRARRGSWPREAAPRQPHRCAHGSMALTRRHGTSSAGPSTARGAPALAHDGRSRLQSRATVGPRSAALEPRRGAAQNTPLSLRLAIQAQRCRSASVRWA